MYKSIFIAIVIISIHKTFGFGKYTCMSLIIVYLCDQATVLLRVSHLPGGLLAWVKILQFDIFDF